MTHRATAMAHRGYRICTRCVMDTSDPLIDFDQEGRCNHCRDYLGTRIKLLHQDASGESLRALFERLRVAGKGAAYDCVVGLSGGVDSSFVALLAREAGLRVLAVHLDNGWDSPIAVENIRNLVERLNLEYRSYVLPWNDFRAVQLAFLRGSVPEAETPTDISIQRAVHDFAIRERVRHILSGGNLASEGILPAAWHYNARDTHYSYAILKRGGCNRKLFRSQKFGLVEEAKAKLIYGIQTSYPLNYLPYRKEEARRRLERDFAWKYYGVKHGESRFTRFIQTYYLVLKHGIDYRRATLSTEICTGAVTRPHALEVLNTSPFDPREIEMEIAYVAKKLAISPQELKSIIHQPAKWFFDYPNRAWMLGKFYDLYRYFAGKEKTSSF